MIKDTKAIESAEYTTTYSGLTKDEKDFLTNLETTGEATQVWAKIDGFDRMIDVVFLNYSKFKMNTEFDDLFSNIFLNGVLENVHLLQVAGHHNRYVVPTGNHRTGALIIANQRLKNWQLPAQIMGEIDLADKKAVTFFYLNQALHNKRVKRDSKELLKLATEAFQAGTSIKVIADTCGVSEFHIQKYLKVSGEGAMVLERLGFDLNTNPFTPTQLSVLAENESFVTVELWDSCDLTLNGTSGATKVFVGKIKKMVEKQAEEKKKADTAGGISLAPDEKIVSVPKQKSVKNEKTGKKEIKTETEEIVVSKSEQVYTLVLDVKTFYSELSAIAIEHDLTDLNQLIAEAFKIA